MNVSLLLLLRVNKVRESDEEQFEGEDGRTTMMMMTMMDG